MTDYRMQVFYRKNKMPMWKHWKFLDECTDHEKEVANLRTMRPNEIFLDMETKEWVVLKDRLDRWNYQVYDSGSRGVHIHLFFDGLLKQKMPVRNAIRRLFLKRFPEVDQTKFSEKTLISIEDKPHHKTGKPKRMIYSITKHERNQLPQGMIQEAIKSFERTYEPINKVKSDWIRTDPFLKYAMTHEITKEIGRHSILFKNLAIGLCQSGLSDAEIEKYANIIVRNCPGQTLSAFMGWVRAYRSGRYQEYNQKELHKWFKEYKEEIEDDEKRCRKDVGKV